MIPSRTARPGRPALTFVQNPEPDEVLRKTPPPAEDHRPKNTVPGRPRSTATVLVNCPIPEPPPAISAQVEPPSKDRKAPVIVAT
jgi:hypothetical protein